MRFTGESHIPQLTDEEFAAVRASTRPFTICILKAGPKFEPPGPDPTVGVTAIIFAHGRRNTALFKSGLMPIVCPISDGSGTTGVSIFDTSLEDAKRIMDGDPGVQAGVFTYELHPCRSIPGNTPRRARTLDSPEGCTTRVGSREHVCLPTQTGHNPCALAMSTSPRTCLTMSRMSWQAA